MQEAWLVVALMVRHSRVAPDFAFVARKQGHAFKM